VEKAIQDAVHFYLDPFTPLLQAMIRAEGGPEAFVTAVRCSFPETADLPGALARAGKTICGRVIAYQQFGIGPLVEMVRRDERDPWTGEQGPRRLRFTDRFIEFLGAHWAPLGVANDPTNLNRHWIPNVRRIYADLVAEPRDAGSGRTESA
jgi:hypothetical protein